MVVASGSPPYDYGIPTPLRSPFLACNNVGMSGNILEAAMFVVQAERRRFQNSVPDGFVHGDYKKYTHPDVIPTDPFEPKADGSTLADSVKPGQIDVNNISVLRDELWLIMLAMSNDTNFDEEEVLTDWIRNTYRENPSGQYSDIPTGNKRGIFLRPRLGGQVEPGDSFGSSLETGRIETTDIHWLGGSGVIFDLDVGEVMWNPYPYIRDDFATDFHNPNDGQWFVWASPIFPRFQKTDGGLVSVSQRDKDAYELILNQDDTLLTPTESGVVRLDGYVLHPTTDYRLGLGQFGFSATDDFTHTAQSTRNFLSDTIPTSRAFLTPKTQSSGVYRVLARNRKVNIPSTTLESGVISQWPKAEDAAEIGYEVFDDAIWVTDEGRQTTTTSTVASGLSVVSPFTADVLWLRHAENPIGSLFPHSDFWGRSVGLERRSSTRVERLEASGSPPFRNFWNPRMFRWDDELDLISTTALTLSAPGIGTDQTETTIDMTFNGTNYYFLGRRSNGRGVIWTLDSALIELFRNGFPGSSGTTPRFQGVGSLADGRRLGFALAGWSSSVIPTPQRTILEFFTDATNGLTFGIPKILQNSWGNSGFTRVHDIIEVTSSTHLPDGVWALVIHQTSGGGARRLYLMHIFETSSTWEVKAEILLISSAGSTNAHRQIMYNDIN